MKIGVNARFLAKPYTGIGQHTVELFAKLSSRNPEDKFILVAAEKIAPEILAKFPKNAEIIVLPESFMGSAGMKKTFWEQWQLRRYFLKRGVDLVHIPYPAGFWWKFAKPVFVTVHDTIPWSLDEYKYSFFSRLYNKMARLGLKKATHIFTVSKTSLEDILNILAVPRNKISISHNAVDDFGKDKIDDLSKKNILKKYGIPLNQPFFLYLGGYDERKNVRTLLNAYNAVIAGNYEYNLVLGGGKSLNKKLYKSYDEAETILKNDGRKLQGEIIKTGFIEEKDLPAIYQSAHAFITISWHEGCNLPLLEAINSGTATIASDLQVHHEMVGVVPVYCDPMDEMKLAELLKKTIIDQKFLNELKHRAESYEISFSWDKTADLVMKKYKVMI